MSSPTFPTEIFESILWYSSHSTLLATSSVDCTFHLISRKYIFNSVSLKRTLYNRDTVSRARAFLSLLDLVPDIANCVRRIHIDCFGDNLLESSPDSDATPLIAVLSRLPRLNSISLRGKDSSKSEDTWIDWKEVSVELRQTFGRIFRSPLVCEIRLSHICNLSLAIFVGCHSLQHLSFNIVSSRVTLPSKKDVTLRPKLKSLIFRNSFTREHDEMNVTWMFSPEGIFDISQLGKFTFSGEKNHIRPAGIISLCAKSIQSLELKMDLQGMYTETTLTSLSRLPPSPIDLDILHNLTQLIVVAQLTTIDFGEGVEEDIEDVGEEENSEESGEESEGENENEEESEDDKPATTTKTRPSRSFSYRNPLPWLVARLRMLTPASSLSEIVLRLNLSVSDTILRNIDWSDLTHVLSSKNLPSLNLVTMKVSGQYTSLSPGQWAVLRKNKYLSPLIDDGRLVLVNNSPT